MRNPRPSRKADVPPGAQPSSPLWQDPAECRRQYFPRVFAYVYGRIRDPRATERLASQAFNRVFAEAHAFPDEEAFTIRLFTTARELLSLHSLGQNYLGALPSEATSEDDLLQRPDLARILEHLRRFPQREQDIIALKFDAALTNPQIAKVMGLSERKVRLILYRTLQEMRRALG